MKIAFDGKRAIQNFTGLGNYSRLLVELMYKNASQHSYYLFAPKQNQQNSRIQQFLASMPLLQCFYPQGIHKYLPSLWRSWSICNDLTRQGVDIFHGLSGELPFNIRKCQHLKSVVTIHDVIFERFPQYYHFFDRHIYSYKFRKACQNADRVIAISQCTKRDIMELYNVPAEKIDVVYQGCDESFKQVCSPQQLEEVRKQFNLPQRFMLNVGTIEERKNALLIVEAMQKVPEDVSLVIVGRKTKYTQLIEDRVKVLQLASRIHICRIPFQYLPAVYQMAEVFVYPSRYEGFGIPILEALHSGTPVIAATGSCLEEAGGPDSLYVHPDDSEALAQSINNVLTNNTLRQNMITKGKEWAQNFSIQNQFTNILKVYESL